MKIDDFFQLVKDKSGLGGTEEPELTESDADIVAAKIRRLKQKHNDTEETKVFDICRADQYEYIFYDERRDIRKKIFKNKIKRK